MNKPVNTRTVPIIITLAAAGITSVISILQHVDFGTFVIRLLVTVVLFMVAGTIVKMILDHAFKVIEELPEADETEGGESQDFPEGEDGGSSDVELEQEEPDEDEDTQES